MRLVPHRRPVALAGALSAALMVVAPSTATAAPVFTDTNTKLAPFYNAYTYATGAGLNCQVTPVPGGQPAVPLVENGGPATASASLTASWVDANHPTDTASMVGSATASGAVTSSGGNLKTIDLTGQGSATLSQPGGPSACERYGGAGVDLDFTFTVAQAGFLTITAKNSGGLYGEAYLYRGLPGDNSGTYVDLYGNALKFSGTEVVYLPAGTYSGYFESEPYVDAQTNLFSASGTVTVHASFAVSGSQTEPVAGKGKHYVTLPSSRSCAAHTLTPVMTSHKKSAAKVKSVAFFVNDAKVKKVKTPDRNDAFALPVADDSDAVFRAEVTLFPRQPGRPAKVLTVTSTYEACS